MTDEKTVQSPSGNIYSLDEKLTANYWSEKSEQSPWKWVGGADMDGDLSYEFNEVAVYHHETTNDLLIAHDSGCSCPTPFEDHTVANGTFITSLVEFDEYVDDSVVYPYNWTDEPVKPKLHPHVVDDVAALRKKVEELLG